MLPSLTQYSVAALVVSALAVALAGFAYRHRSRPGVLWAEGMFLAVAVWTFGYSMELADSGVGWKLFWSQFQYLGVATVPVAFFWVATSHSGSAVAHRRRWVGATLIVPVITIALAWTNSVHGLLWTSVEVFERGTLSVAAFEYGPWFAVHVGYAYVMIVAGSLTLLRRVREGNSYRFQAMVLLAAALAPWVANLLHVTRVTPLYPLDLTPFGFALSAVAVCYGLFRFELLRFVPAARDLVVESMQDGVLVVDDCGRIVDSNPAASRLTGWSRRELIGSDLRDVIQSKACKLESTDEQAAILSTRMPADGAECFYEISVSPLAGTRGGRTGSIVVLRDVTRQKRDAAQIQFLALRDPLTELPNRDLLGDRLERALSTRREDTCLAVLFLDLDDFKKVNDHYGHSAGDELLQQVSERILSAIREADTVAHAAERNAEESVGRMLARFGGDEFVILLDDLPVPEAAAEPARRILEVIHQPFDIQGTRMTLGGSIGIAMYPGDGNDAESLLRAADAAMYEAKRAGGCFQYFTRGIDEAVRRRVETETELHRALDEGELEIYFQPQVDAETFDIVGLEALLRWNHPVRGLLVPDEFLAVAERSGIILAIDSFVIDSACREWARLYGHSSNPPTLALNISPRRIGQSDFAAEVVAATRRHGIPPKHFELEITEHVLMENTETTRAVLESLRSLGVGIVIDDFGTGYSSLGYLMRFELDRLKIDRHFVQRIDTDIRAQRLVEAVIAVGHGLDLNVVGEGVETAWQRDFLVRAGCDRLQGYLFGWPVPAHALQSEPTAGSARGRKLAARREAS